MGTPLHRRTEGIGACLADPFANGEGRIELIRSPSPKGAGGGCIDRVIILAQSAARCQSKTYAGYLHSAQLNFRQPRRRCRKFVSLNAGASGSDASAKWLPRS